MPKSLETEGTVIRRESKLRLRAERAEGRLAELLSNMPEAYVAIDRDWRITFANEQAARMGRKRAEEFVGKNVWAVWPGTVGTEIERQYRRVMETRVAAQFEYFSLTNEAWFELNVHPAEDGIDVYFLDTTQRRRAEEALQESEHRYNTSTELNTHERKIADVELEKSRQEAEHQRLEIETIYRTAPVGLALFDPVEFRCLSLNERQAEIVGLPIEEILGRTVTEIAPIEGLHEMFQQAANGQTIANRLLEGELPMQPGVHRYWTVNYSPVYGPDGNVRAIIAASLEITAQQRAERALIQSEKLAAVGRLASSISHEINNPLEAVINLLYLATSHEQLPKEVGVYLRSAQDELARVSQIATQSLRFHRQTMNPTLVSAAEMINSVVDLYQGRLFNSNIQVHAFYASATKILCFENDIRQVLNNLISNAIDAMRHGGHLLLRTHDATDWRTGRKGIRVTVADTGHGMSAQVRRHIFEAFYTTKDLNGTGLGLWISRGIVVRHHGHLTLRSSETPKHSGTVFALFLPNGQSSSEPMQ